MRIALVTDSHLAAAASGFNANWDAVREYIGRVGTDLTIHLGDITLDAWSDPAQRDFARNASQGWPTPLLFLPGNHDVGDNPPGPHTPSAHPLDTERLAAYRRLFGPDYWTIAAEGWQLIALDVQLLGSGTSAEAEQWEWLASNVDRFAHRPVALLLHKPLFWRDPVEDVPHIRYVPAAPRQRLCWPPSIFALCCPATRINTSIIRFAGCGISGCRRPPSVSPTRCRSASAKKSPGSACSS